MKLILLMLLMTCFLVISQVFLKKFLDDYPKDFSLFESLLQTTLNQYFYMLAIIVSMLLSVLIWVKVLRGNEFSSVYPMVAFSYLWGLLAGHFIFNETITIGKMMGVGFIGIGVALVNS